jgi:hypothetical protein
MKSPLSTDDLSPSVPGPTEFSTPSRPKALSVVATVAALLVIAGGAWLWAQQVPGFPFPGPQPSIGAFTVTPNIIAVGEPTTVQFTVHIDTPTLNPASVELLRVDQDGKVLASLGRMWDTGTHGDGIPGDKIFSLAVTLRERFPGVRFQVSASFRGLPRTITSNVVLIPVWNTVSSTDAGVSFLYPPEWTFLEHPDGSFSLNSDTLSDIESAEGTFDVFARVLPNPEHRTIEGFFDGHHGPNLYEGAPNVDTVDVSRIVAIRFRQLTPADVDEALVIPLRDTFLLITSTAPPQTFDGFLSTMVIH